MKVRTTIAEIKARKNGEKITMLTAYDYTTAKIIDGEVDILLVGDSLGMVIHGFESTTPVTMDLMRAHTAAVARGSAQSLIVADLPYHSWDIPGLALANAKSLLDSGAHGVKLEGADDKALAAITALRAENIEVMGHVGLLPQSVALYGGYKVQGRSEEDAARIINDSRALEAAGCFAIIIEAVPRQLADKITKNLNVPTIGIGASPGCDGQVLVVNDMLGLTEKPPRFVKNYGQLREAVAAAVKNYAGEVKAGSFPGKDNCY